MHVFLFLLGFIAAFAFWFILCYLVAAKAKKTVCHL